MSEKQFPPYYGTDAIDCGPDPSEWSNKLSEELGLQIFKDEQFRVKRVEAFLVGLHSLCQLDCPFCTGHYSPTRKLLPRQELNIDRLIELVWLHKKETGFNIATINMGCTGEVLIHPQFTRVIGETQDAVDNFDMLTNLSIKNQKVIEFVANHPQFKNITISCDAGDEDTYRRLRVGGEFGLVTKNAGILSKSGKRLFMRAIVYKENRDSLLKLPEILRDSGFKGLHLIYTYDSPETLSTINFTKYTYEEFKAFFITMLAKCKDCGINLSTDPSFYVPDMIGIIPGFETEEQLASYSSAPCDNLYRFTITPEGNHFYCCHFESKGYFARKTEAAFYKMSLTQIFDDPSILTHRKLQALGYFPEVCKKFCSKVDKPKKEHEAVLYHNLRHPDTNLTYSLDEFISEITGRPEPLVIRALSPAMRKVLAAYPKLGEKIAFIIDHDPNQESSSHAMITPQEFHSRNGDRKWIVLVASDRATVFDTILNSFDHFKEIYKLNFFEAEMKDYKVRKLFPSAMDSF
ncbi:MAG: radical SAM protein [Syntrophobacteraceae bacterium]